MSRIRWRDWSIQQALMMLVAVGVVMSVANRLLTSSTDSTAVGLVADIVSIVVLGTAIVVFFRVLLLRDAERDARPKS